MGQPAALMLAGRGSCFVSPVLPDFTRSENVCFEGTRVWPHVGICDSLPSSPRGLLRVSKRAQQEEAEAKKSVAR